MADDVRALLNGLREYRDSLTKHVSQLQAGYDSLSREWQQLDSVYHGDAAHEFRGLWMRTTDNFQEYMERSHRIIKILDERITFLQETDRPNSS